MEQEATPTTLRHRTRQFVTREVLETALRLFTEQGYDETPVAQVAHEAGISQRTLFRYFGTKEDLLGGNENHYTQILATALRDQPTDVSAWRAIRAGIVEIQASHESREQALERFRLLHSTASLRAGWLEKRLRLQEDLLPLVQKRMGPASELAARAMIATVFACLDVASVTWVEGNGKGELMDVYDECLTAVRGPSTTP